MELTPSILSHRYFLRGEVGWWAKGPSKFCHHEMGSMCHLIPGWTFNLPVKSLESSILEILEVGPKVREPTPGSCGTLVLGTELPCCKEAPTTRKGWRRRSLERERERGVKGS